MKLSLARIMYGTNEDFHAQAVHNAAVFAISARATEKSAVTAVLPEELRGLLHKVWKNLSGKR